MDEIISLGECELLCQLAEESAELAQAALKLRRAIDGRNPTPKTIEECREALNEEAADCELLFRLLGLHSDDSLFKQSEIMEFKENRWKDRLAKAKGCDSLGRSEMDKDHR